MNRAAHQFGASLVEALVALLVLSFGLLGAAHFHSLLRQSADGVRQRAEAVRLAVHQLEHLRGFAHADVHAAIADEAVDVDRAATTFHIVRAVAEDEGARHKPVSIEVAWADRRRRAQSLTLATSIDGTPAVFSGLLALARSPLAPLPAAGSPRLPWGAVRIGEELAASTPSARHPLLLIFDLASGDLRSVCTSAMPATAQPPDACEAVTGPVAFGHVQFATAGPGVPPMPLSITLVPAAASHCLAETRKRVRYGQGAQSRLATVDDTATPADWQELERFTAFTCWRDDRSSNITTDELRIVPEGWTIGVAAGEQRVCRHLDEDAPATSSRQHNFLVQPGPLACPQGTQAHQPPGDPNEQPQ
jgi:Tfp pilus assembly protein PilV